MNVHNWHPSFVPEQAAVSGHKGLGQTLHIQRQDTGKEDGDLTTLAHNNPLLRCKGKNKNNLSVKNMKKNY